MNGENSELALIKLMELFNHSSVAITKRYLGFVRKKFFKPTIALPFRKRGQGAKKQPFLTSFLEDETTSHTVHLFFELRIKS